MGLGFLGFAVFGGSSTIVMIIFNVLKGCGVGMAGGMALGMVADTITYGTKKTGIDTVGLGNAGVSAAQKIGLGLGTAVFGWVLNGAGYDGSLDAQGIAIYHGNRYLCTDGNPVSLRERFKENGSS